MRLDKAAHWVERYVFPLNGLVRKLALVILLLMMFLTVGDVVGRYLVGRLPFFQPIPGTYELTEFMLVIMVFTALGYAQIRKDHITIDALVSRFSIRTQSVIDSITYLFSLALFSLVTWQSAVFAYRLFLERDVSGILMVPIYPFVIVVAIGSFLFCLVLLLNLLSSFAKAVKHES